MAKVKVASDWLTGCAGCHMSLLDIDERIVQLAEAVEFTSTPITDLKKPHAVVVGLLEGCVANTTNLAVAKEMRDQCQILVAFGDCACLGGVPAMRNPLNCEEALRRAYVESESTVDGVVPDDEELACMLPRVKAVHEVVKVDVNLPGCPPSADAIFFALSELLAGRIPVIAGDNLRYD
jgi:NAD-reducing hydrogenase small subunit